MTGVGVGHRLGDLAHARFGEAAHLRVGHDPDSTARIGLDGVEAGRFVIVPHPEVRGFAEARMRQIAEAIDEADGRDTTQHNAS